MIEKMKKEGIYELYLEKEKTKFSNRIDDLVNVLKETILELQFGNAYESLSESSRNHHKWTLYIQPLNIQSIFPVEKVVFKLHPSFKPHSISISQAPFRITRIGWGTFTGM